MKKSNWGIFGFLLAALTAVPYTCAPLPAVATVTNTVTQTTTGYGDGVSTTFPITFDFRHNTWLTVTLYDTSTVPTTVSSIPIGSAGIAGSFSVSGGDPGTTVVMGTPPTSTQFLILSRVIPQTQPVVFSPASIFPYKGMSSQLDAMTLMIQDLGADLAAATGAGSTIPGSQFSTVLVQKATSGTYSIIGTGAASTAYTTLDLFPNLTYNATTNVLNANVQNAVQASSFSAVPTQCAGSSFAQGVAINGNANCSTISTPPATPPGGSSGYVQYNNAGAFGGISTFVLGASTVTVPGLVDSALIAQPVLSNSLGQLYNALISLTNQVSGTLQAAQMPALTGDITTPGASLATTLATVNANVGSFGSSTSIPNFTVNGKGLMTAAGGNVVIAPAGTLTGTTLNSPVVSSSLTSVGTIGTGTWQGTAVGTGFGGTGQSSYTDGQLLIGNSSGNGLTKATLTAGSNITVTNSGGGITIASTASGGATSMPANTILGNSTVATANASTITIPQFNAMFGVPNGTNFLSDPSFEEYTGTSTFWVSTSATGSASTLNYTDGIQSGVLNLVVQSGNIAQSVTPTQQLTGVNMQATCYVKTALTTIQLCALVGGVEQSCTSVPSNGNWTPVTAIFPGPAAGTSIGVDVKTTTSTTGVVNVDQCYVGKAFSLGSGYIANDWNTALAFTFTALGTVTNNFVETRRIGDTLHVKGTVTSGTATSSAIQINLPSGYAIDYSKFNGTTQRDVGRATFVFSSGTFASTSIGPFPIFTDGSSTGNVWIANSESSNTFTKATGTGATFASGNVLTFNFDVPIVGWTSNQAAYRADVTPANWSGYQTVSSGCSTSSATYADPSTCTGIALTQQQNRNFGTVTTAASSLPGIITTPPRPGNYLVCASGTITTTLAATASVDMLDSNGVNLNKGQSLTISAAGDAPFSICGVEPANGSAVTIKLQLAASTSTVAFVNGTASGSGAISWSIVEMDAPMPAPYLTGSVTSTSSAAEHVERANIANCTSSPCTVTLQSGSWISSVTRTSAGLYVVNFTSGEFSAAPTCSLTPYTDTPVSNGNSVPTSSSFTALFRNTGFTAADPTGGFGIICMGPR